MPSDRNMPLLNVPSMNKPILDNYNAHVDNFVRFLTTQLQCTLVYDGPSDIHQHIIQRTTYACSVQWKKILRNVFPVMIGSRLDLAIRYKLASNFPSEIPETFPSAEFQDLDIAQGFFIIHGFLRHLPFFYTNDPTNTHVIQGKVVRVYTYDTHDRGKELNYYTAEYNKYTRGDLVVVHNDGTHTKEKKEIETFFDHCPYPVQPEVYMSDLSRRERFDIDHLANKIVMSPGHLFVKLFVKYLYHPLREQKWSVIKSKTALVVKSIQTGCLLHVLSRKTLYFKEGKSVGKMTNTPHESHREINANGEIFIEKNMGCYREVNMQTYPLNPYLLHIAVRQMSSKVKKDTVSALHPSSVGFLCILGCYETKNVGRTTMMVRDSAISTCDALDPVFHPNRDSAFWDSLRLEALPTSDDYHVVVNEACIPVTKRCFQRISMDLLRLKRHYGLIECFQVDKFVYIRYKMGLFFKRIPDTEVWITPRDEFYWSKVLLGLETKDQLVERFGYPYITSYLVDLNPYFMHNAFPKNILAFNALKNAVLATDKRYAEYFMDSVSAYVKQVTPQHRVVIPAADDDHVSKKFELILPSVVVVYGSIDGRAQEDCIAQHKDVQAFDSVRFHTLRITFEGDGPFTFHPVREGEEGGKEGQVADHSELLGTLVNHGASVLEILTSPIHVRVERGSTHYVHLYFSKPPFRVLQVHVGEGIVSICVEQNHPSGTGDKLCSLHGQKGVVRVMEKTILLDGSVWADLVVNAFGLFRMTLGQIMESLKQGDGKDALTVHNSQGHLVENATAFYGRIYYFAIAYWSIEHLYAPRDCVQDKLLGQSVKGRSRGGGMRLGNMELMNGMRGNGIAACFDTKFFEHGDRMPFTESRVSIPKSVSLVQEDARFYKCNLEYDVEPNVVEMVEQLVLKENDRDNQSKKQKTD